MLSPLVAAIVFSRGRAEAGRPLSAREEPESGRGPNPIGGSCVSAPLPVRRRRFRWAYERQTHGVAARLTDRIVAIQRAHRTSAPAPVSGSSPTHSDRSQTRLSADPDDTPSIEKCRSNGLAPIDSSLRSAQMGASVKPAPAHAFSLARLPEHHGERDCEDNTGVDLSRHRAREVADGDGGGGAVGPDTTILCSQPWECFQSWELFVCRRVGGKPGWAYAACWTTRSATGHLPFGVLGLFVFAGRGC
jgi:hypothetical protein